MTNNSLITVDEVLTHPDFPKRRCSGKSFYIVDDEVRYDFVNSDDRAVVGYFYFDKRRNPNQIAPEHLIWGTRFV